MLALKEFMGSLMLKELLKGMALTEIGRAHV